MNNNKILGGAAAIVGAFLMAPVAQAIPHGVYTLGSHPAGSQAPPAYGLRLDGFMGEGVFTFDFDDARSAMFIEYGENGLRIYGESWGGRDTGDSFADAQLFAIDFNYSVGIVETRDGGMDDTMVAASHENYGRIAALDENRSETDDWMLRDHAGDHPVSLQIGDEGGAGHRNYNGVSGWGWIDWSADGSNWYGSESACCSDWLFTVNVAEPPTVALIAFGLFALAGYARRFPGVSMTER